MLTIWAPAKLNLSLDVLGKRQDGYHEIRSVVQTVSLCDRVRLTAAPELAVDSPITPPEADLAWRAATLLQARYQVHAGAHIALDKEIPLGAGLGGGSADAAAVLVGLNQLWELGLGPGELTAVAAELGSDVPFMIRGGTALIEGRGEQVTQLKAPGHPHFVLAMPDMALSTAEVYGRARPGDGRRSERLLAELATGTWQLAGNDLTEAAIDVLPRLGSLIDDLAARAGVRPQLSGSGSALFWLAPSQQAGAELAVRLPSGLTVRVVEAVEENSLERAKATADRGRDRGAD